MKSFEQQWQQRQQALQTPRANVPNDEVFLKMAKLAQQRQKRHTLHWIHYAAVASVLIGALIFSWNWQYAKNKIPVAQEINLEGQTIRFMCNSGCSAQDIITSANNIINQ